MGKVLSAADTIACSFQGSVTLAPQAKLQIGGQAVLLAGDVTGAIVATCAGAGSQQPVCASVASITAGEARKLRCGGQTVLLDDLDGMTTPAHAPNKLVLMPVVQTKLVAL